MNAEQIIARMGGVKAAAKFTKRTEDLMRKWITWDYIPARHHADIAAKFNIARKHLDAVGKRKSAA